MKFEFLNNDKGFLIFLLDILAVAILILLLVKAVSDNKKFFSEMFSGLLAK